MMIAILEAEYRRALRRAWLEGALRGVMAARDVLSDKGPTDLEAECPYKEEE